jgi:hypothetical protein
VPSTAASATSTAASIHCTDGKTCGTYVDTSVSFPEFHDGYRGVHPSSAFNRPLAIRRFAVNIPATSAST